MENFTEPQCVWSVAAELGEGPLWSSAEEAVWFVDIKKDRIHRFEPSSRRKRSYETPSSPSFLVPDKAGKFVVGAHSGLHRFDPTSGDFSLLFEVEPHKSNNRLNDGTLDREGRLWFGSMDNGEREKSGSLFRLDRTGPVAVDRGIAITNGPTFSPDGRILYHTETAERTIYAFDVAGDGSLSRKRVFVTIEEGVGFPDGSVTDAEGCVWTCLFFGSAARRYSPSGKLISTVRFPCSNVTKMVFAGPDLRTAYATTARHLLNAEHLAVQPFAGGLFRFDVDVPGLPQGVWNE